MVMWKVELYYRRRDKNKRYYRYCFHSKEEALAFRDKHWQMTPSPAGVGHEHHKHKTLIRVNLEWVEEC